MQPWEKPPWCGWEVTLPSCSWFSSQGNEQALDDLIGPVSQSFDLRHHVDAIEGELLHHVEPDVRITVYGADRSGIVAEITGTLTEKGFNILNLESDVGGTAENPIYIMTIEGIAEQGIDILEEALQKLAQEKGLETQLEPIDTLIG